MSSLPLEGLMKDVFQPLEWTRDNYIYRDYALVTVPQNSEKFVKLSRRVDGSFNWGITMIKRVQNPFLYAQFLLKKEEYESCGYTRVMELLHDTEISNVHSIVSENFDWQMIKRYKYGQGVSFSTSPAYANQYSGGNSTQRAMIVADVLVGRCEMGSRKNKIPSHLYDTTVSDNGKVYVKYNNDEFYPKYVVYYDCAPRDT